MKLTARCEYALLALIHLRRRESEGIVSVDAIASAQNIPAKFLEQIMTVLKQAKYVRSARGRRGGYRLVKSADKITLAEIVRLFDGALAPTESVSRHFYMPTPIEREDKLVHVFRCIRDSTANTLETTTINDVL
jgi:Rrf2 family transcriptional regulator, cysteine metabolism repressor